MSDLSLFDVIGPKMVGPSSSHTAGACRIARIAGRLFGDDIARVTFTLYGSFAETYKGHGSDKALVGGILGYTVYDLRIRDSLEHAKNLGVDYEFITDSHTEVGHANTIGIHIENSDKSKVFDIVGVSVGGGKIEIININGIEVSFTGEYPTAIVYHKSVPGMLAFITGKFGNHNVNIASLRCYRTDAHDNAIAVIESDDEISPAIVDDIESHNLIFKTIILKGNPV